MTTEPGSGPRIQTPSVRYSREPVSRTGSGLPIFATADSYTRNYDRIAQKHLKSLDEQGVNPFMSEATWGALDTSTLAILRDLVKPGDVLFDAGVGLGGLLSAFPDNERHGVDVSPDYLERTRTRGIHVAVARLEDLPYSDAAFDCVISTDVLEHVLDLYGASREIVRVLRPGGHLVVRVPLEEDMKAYYDYREFEFVHVRRFDLWSLRLHFERIFGLDYVSHSRVLPLYRGLSTSRLATVEDGEAIRQVLRRLPNRMPGVAELRDFTALTPDIFNSFMNAVAVQHPAVFEELVTLLAGYLEINIVFRKPEAPAA